MNKTQAPTPRRIKQARDKGQVWKSKEFTGSILLIIFWAILVFSFSSIVEKLIYFSRYIFSNIPSVLIRPQNLLVEAWNITLAIIFPFLVVLFIISSVVVFLQVGPLFTFETLKPDLTKFNPVEGIKKLFNKQNFFETVKSIIKCLIISVILYSIVKDNLRYIIMSPYVSLRNTGVLFNEIVSPVVFKGGLALVVIGIFDLLYQRWHYFEGLKMTIQEVRQEYKETEGDASIKRERKRIHQEILMHNMIENVKKADVVIVNPTHIAVALKYDQEKDNAPRIVAKGEQLYAKKIIEVAKSNRVPILRNVELAHSLIDLQLDEEIPKELYEVVAEVLKFIYQQKENE